MLKVKCAGCALTAETKTRDNVPVWARKTGWGCYSNVGNGLTFEVTCPGCQGKLDSALKTIFEVFGDESRHIYFGATFTEMMKAAKKPK